ncbi:MAG: hypothetical protein RMJ56_12260 [Gemmataceae bacterium]|nr:hypothetical protein [Gemmata sp.]MDW8198366.1 hypothetical protein [Gemmataceae bacterium]
MFVVGILFALGQPPFHLAPPSDAEVIAALPKSPLPFVEILGRDDISLTKTIQSGVKIGPLLLYPLLGSGHAVEATWQCEVTCTERLRLRFPVSVEVAVQRRHMVEIPVATVVPAP